MLTALLHSFSILKDRFFWRLILLSSLMTLALLAVFTGGVSYGITLFGLEDSWLAWLGAGAASILGWFLAPLAFPLITTLFLETVVGYMETHYYGRQATNPASLARTLPASIKFVLVALFLNLLALPLYVIPGMYYVVNGYLYGREYFELVALRYHDRKETKKLRKKHRLKLMLAGVVVMLMFTVPGVNLIAPILATVFIAHLYFNVVK